MVRKLYHFRNDLRVHLSVVEMTMKATLRRATHRRSGLSLFAWCEKKRPSGCVETFLLDTRSNLISTNWSNCTPSWISTSHCPSPCHLQSVNKLERQTSVIMRFVAKATQKMWFPFKTIPSLPSSQSYRGRGATLGHSAAEAGRRAAKPKGTFGADPMVELETNSAAQRPLRRPCLGEGENRLKNSTNQKRSDAGSLFSRGNPCI